ncbi:MAG: ABC transporter substrate-binding protein [Candidatus Zixiibacteriota bacterium]
MVPSLKNVLYAIGVAVAAVVSSSTTYGAPIEIAVLTSDSSTSTLRTLAGAEKVIAQEYPQASFTSFTIGRDSVEDQSTVIAIRSLGPTLILTIGSSATELAKRNFEDIPIVFSAVKYPELSGFVESNEKPGRNITGASLDIPTDVQFGYFQKIIPSLKKLGVLYTENTASLIPQAKIVAGQLGLELVALNVESDKGLPAALDSLTSVVDALWSVADPNLFKPQSTRYILLQTVRKQIPFMGFSRYVVESGALCALDFDYKAVGLQAGAIANRVISGVSPDSIAVTSADVIWFHYNENTAKRINITIPEELVAVAKEVYR